MTYRIPRRTFEAARHPKGSAERARLNEDVLTSEYMTSKVYALIGNDGQERSLGTFATRAEAMAYISAREGDPILAELAGAKHYG